MRTLRELLHEGPIHGDQTAWQALDYLNLYRLFVAMLYTGLFFTPVMSGAYLSAQLYAARSITILFLIISPILFVLGRRWRHRIGSQAGIGLAFDLIFNLLMLRLMGGISSGVGVLLAGAMGASGAIFPLQSALVYAATATIAVLWQATLDVWAGSSPISVVVPHGLLGATFFATAMLGSYLASRVRESQAIVRQRSEDVANLATLNEMIIERMRTGILIIDPKDNTHVMNDSAWYLMGMPPSRNGKLADLAPALVDDLQHWKTSGEHLNHSVKLASGVPPVVPRFARLGVGEPSDTLVFLEDTSMVSRRAQEITLSSLGRLSASIAHEIRNPLAAISHSAQLLDESSDLAVADRRLTDIITRHCVRMNKIIENVLQLARQGPARPESVDLEDWLQSFVREFRRSHDLGNSQLEVEPGNGPVLVLVDPVQLQQVMWNLCQNALKYGRGEDGQAQVRIRAGQLEGGLGPMVEVSDSGSGITDEDRERIFQPFFTSSPDGTGLGLYLCQQLCAANQAFIEYLPNPSGGSTFRILLISAPETQISEVTPETAQSSDSTA